MLDSEMLSLPKHQNAKQTTNPRPVRCCLNCTKQTKRTLFFLVFVAASFLFSTRTMELPPSASVFFVRSISGCATSRAGWSRGVGGVVSLGRGFIAPPAPSTSKQVRMQRKRCTGYVKHPLPFCHLVVEIIGRCVAKPPLEMNLLSISLHCNNSFSLLLYNFSNHLTLFLIAGYSSSQNELDSFS